MWKTLLFLDFGGHPVLCILMKKSILLGINDGGDSLSSCYSLSMGEWFKEASMQEPRAKAASSISNLGTSS